MQEKYYKSDFMITETDGDFKNPFRFKYYVSGGHIPFIAMYDGTSYINCKVNEKGGLDVFFKKQRMGIGQLMVEKSFLHSNADGSCQWVKSCVAKRDVTLTDQPITIGAEMVDGGGVELKNIDVDIATTEGKAVVRLSGDFSVDVDDESVKLF